jgi:glycerol-3-phosphate O-acyltransferase/dihydroxyacetone phosphate acyltransferase
MPRKWTMQWLVIALIRLIADTFFRRIEVAGVENVPTNGPVIFAGNHPNALMDGWLLTAKTVRWPLYFLANAKLWKYRMLVPILNATGAIPVYRREDHDGEVDNKSAFDRLYEVIESGDCVCIFPEGISHVESQLVKLKTGTARIALTVASRGNAVAPIVPCGLNYIHRHRFRSQVLIQFGKPIEIDDEWLRKFHNDEQEAVVELTECLAGALKDVTVNAPDWSTLRFIQSARRLYKPSSVQLTPRQYVELNRRFANQYVKERDDPDLQELTTDLENYQARLDMLGLKDHQLRQPLTLSHAFRKLFLRSVMMLALLPLAVPGAILHLPIGWIAAAVGERFSYEMDDVATLKVFSTVLLLPIMYLAVSITVAIQFGVWWGVALFVALPFSFLASVRLVEAEVSLVMSMASIFRLARLGRELDDLRSTRAGLVTRIRNRVERYVDSGVERIFTKQDFSDDTPEQ